MKAKYYKSFVQVIKNSSETSYIFITDLINLSHHLSLELADVDVNFSNRIFILLKRQKNARDCVQKFNAICEALEL